MRSAPPWPSSLLAHTVFYVQNLVGAACVACGEQYSHHVVTTHSHSRLYRQLRAKQGRFKAGIADANFDAAAEWASNLGWHGPFILATDDTKIVAGIRSYCDGDQWYLGGVHGVVHTFASYDELLELANTQGAQVADKVRLDV